MSLILRNLFWAALLPGVVAGLVPWYYFGVDPSTVDIRRPLDLVRVLVIVTGVVLTVACIVAFARRGQGTLSPLDPPRLLVVSGLYRYVRNPMYLGVATIGIGELMLWPSRGLVIWWVAWFAWVNVFVRVVEEPALRRQFGSRYDRYVRSVGRWIPRLGPYTMDS